MLTSDSLETTKLYFPYPSEDHFKTVSATAWDSKLPLLMEVDWKLELEEYLIVLLATLGCICRYINKFY